MGAAAYVLYYGKRLAPGIFYAMHGIGRGKNLQNKLKKLHAAPPAIEEQPAVSNRAA